MVGERRAEGIASQKMYGASATRAMGRDEWRAMTHKVIM